MLANGIASSANSLLTPRKISSTLHFTQQPTVFAWNFTIVLAFRSDVAVCQLVLMDQGIVVLVGEGQ